MQCCTGFSAKEIEEDCTILVMLTMFYFTVKLWKRYFCAFENYINCFASVILNAREFL